VNWKRLIVYLFLNAAVSAAVTLGVLYGWDKTHPQTQAAPCVQALPAPSLVSPAIGSTPTAAIASARPTVTPSTYVVQSGDTLGVIAQRYNLTLEQLMAANALTDPNVLNVGQTLIIPGNGYVPPPPPTGTPGALPTNAAEPPRPTATANPNAPPSQVAIREVKSPGNLADETVVITNQGGPVGLAGWTLADQSGHLYRFPALTLFEGGAVSLHTGLGSDTVTDLYWGLTEPVWASGRQALLSDAGGNLQTRFAVP
jgi:LysM repeat protein